MAYPEAEFHCGSNTETEIFLSEGTRNPQAIYLTQPISRGHKLPHHFDRDVVIEHAYHSVIGETIWQRPPEKPEEKRSLQAELHLIDALSASQPFLMQIWKEAKTGAIHHAHLSMSARPMREHMHIPDASEDTINFSLGLLSRATNLSFSSTAGLRFMFLEKHQLFSLTPDEGIFVMPRWETQETSSFLAPTDVKGTGYIDREKEIPVFRFDMDAHVPPLFLPTHKPGKHIKYSLELPLVTERATDMQDRVMARIMNGKRSPQDLRSVLDPKITHISITDESFQS